MDAFLQYLKDTRGELRHVAWPTQMQTIVYTILVALLSVGVALYLGLFDFLFTTSLARVVNALPSSYSAPSVEVQQQPTPTPTTGTAPATPVTKGQVIQIVPSTEQPPKK